MRLVVFMCLLVAATSFATTPAPFYVQYVGVGEWSSDSSEQGAKRGYLHVVHAFRRGRKLFALFEAVRWRRSCYRDELRLPSSMRIP